MKNVSIALTIILSFLCISSHAQEYVNTNSYWKGEIITTSGKTIKGFIRVPDEREDKNVIYRLKEDGEKIEIPSEEIESINVVSGTDKKFTFERIPIRVNYKKDKISDKLFLLVFKKGNHATFYIASTAYLTDSKKGIMIIESSFYIGKELPDFTYFIRKKDQSFADFYCETTPSPTVYGLNSMLKVRSAYLLADDQPLVKRIQNGEFKHPDIPEIISIYLEDMK